MQASIACVLGLVTCHLNQNNMAASAGAASQSCCFEQLEHHKVGFFVEKGNSKRLKKSKKFAFGNSQFTRQHIISLSGTNKHRRIADKIIYIRPVISHQLGGCRVGFKFD